MKKFLIKIALFFAIIAVVDIAIGYAGDKLRFMAKGGGTGKSQHICYDATEDVLMFGSSRMLHSFVPDVFADTLGASVYNCGAGGNGIILAYGYLQMIVRSNHLPSLIIYDGYSFDMYQDDNVKYIDGLRPYSKEKPEVLQTICDIDGSERVKCLSNMYCYNSKMIRLVMDAYIPYTKTQRGYIPLYGHLSYEPSSAPETTPLIDEVKLKYAEKFIDLAKENNIQIVFTASPKYGMGSDNYFAPIAAICAKKNVPFWNYYVSTEFSRERSLFEDPVHMNDKGAREFSAVVAHQIKTELNYK
jgi:hypothetical protein